MSGIFDSFTIAVFDHLGGNEEEFYSPNPNGVVLVALKEICRGIWIGGPLLL